MLTAFNFSYSYRYSNRHLKKMLVPAALVLFFMMSLVIGGCGSDKSKEQEVVYVTEGYQGVVSYRTKINMRSGPSKTSSIITTLNPGDHVMVYASNKPDDYWLYIKAPNGQSGYVSHKLLSYDKTKAIKKAVTQPAATSTTLKSSSTSGYKIPPYKRSSSPKWGYISNPIKGRVPPICALSASVYSSLLHMSKTSVWLVMLGVILVEFGLIFALRYYYKETYKPSPIWIWVIQLVSMALTIPTIVLFFFIGKSPQEYTVYTLLLLSTACLMLNCAWRIKQIGMDGGIRRNENTTHYELGLFLGEILWIAVLIPMVSIWWYVVWDSDMHFWMFQNNWISLIIGCVLAAALLPILSFLSMLITGWFFYIANQSIYYIVNYIIVAGILVILFRFTWAHYYEWWLVLPIACIILSFFGCLFEKFHIKLLKFRCPNCHSMDVHEEDRELIGEYTESSTHWRNTSTDGIKAYRTGAYVSDAQEQYRSVWYMEAWNIKHLCNECRNQWDVREDKLVGGDEYDTGRTRHKETW